MLGTTHLLAGFVAGSAVSWPAAAASSLAALVPDIDTPESKIGKLVPPLSFALNKIFGHRNFFHSVWAVLAVYVLLKMFWPLMAAPAAVGYASHIVLDMLNPAGVRLFWPLRLNVAFPLVTAGSLLEYLVVYPLLGILFYWVHF